jgi:hypothetical protein
MLNVYIGSDEENFKIKKKAVTGIVKIQIE